MRQVSENEFYAYISKYDYYMEDNDELRVKNAPYDEYLDIKQIDTDRLLGRISEFLLNHELKYVYEIQEEKMSDDFIAWLYDKAREYYCGQYQFCINCPFYADAVDSCVKLTADQKRKILMKIYESEVNTDASNN